MNFCINLKKRKNKPYCKIKKENILLNQCKECKDKEYKTKIRKNSSYKNDIKISNNNQIKKNAQLQEKISLKKAKMHNKSKKLAKLERERSSVFTEKDKCFICGSKYKLTWNEIYRGRNRLNSMKFDFCLRMCLTCHSKYQDDIKFNDYWHQKAQLYFEKNIGSREEFIKIFRKNYLK